MGQNNLKNNVYNIELSTRHTKVVLSVLAAFIAGYSVYTALEDKEQKTLLETIVEQNAEMITLLKEANENAETSDFQKQADSLLKNTKEDDGQKIRAQSADMK